MSARILSMWDSFWYGHKWGVRVGLGGDCDDSVAVSGGFDPLHVGHLELFDKALKYGKNLVVILNDNAFLDRKKGKAFMDQLDRARIIASLRQVYAVCLVQRGKDTLTEPGMADDDMTVCRPLKLVHPKVFVNGGDRDITNVPEVKTCSEEGIAMLFGAGKKIRSSSEILEAWEDR